ncbi:MAG: hypothetical protein N3G74_02440 [Candidatus Micrarchaeota archaeon]|nr:hypothetical protein [Candidatus Micrarchaeota archaeon]
MNIWVFLLFTALGIWGTVYLIAKERTPKSKLRELTSRAVKLGVFLLAFDFVFENAGLLLGYWNTSGSILQIGAVPIEVMGIAFCAGFTYAVLFQKRFDWQLGFFSSVWIAAAGTAIEAILVGFEVLNYAGGWTSLHAFAAYVVAFMIMHKANSIL